MVQLVDIAGRILSQATQRVEIHAQNISNGTTSGYKRRIAFERFEALVGGGGGSSFPLSTIESTPDFLSGKLIETGNPLDLAIVGDGFFSMRGPEGLVLTRQGQFQRDSAGRLVTPGGLALQADGGGDLIVPPGAFTVARDGLVMVDGELVDRLALVDAPHAALRTGEGGAFSVPESEITSIAMPVVRQGAYEASNVSTGQEMVAMMEALRRAESGQRLVTVYDDLMGRALTTLGQA